MPCKIEKASHFYIKRPTSAKKHKEAPSLGSLTLWIILVKVHKIVFFQLNQNYLLIIYAECTMIYFITSLYVYLHFH
jgi:hypothetical protein